MDPIRTYLGRLLLEEITPVVMVITTPLVEEACQKNGFSFVDMLLPFSLFPRIDVPVRTASDQPYRLQMFKLRLFYASNIRKQSYEAAEEHLKRIIYDLNEKNPPDLMSEPPQLETALAKSESDLCPAWIKTFNKELIRTVSFSEHETFDHPVACILVASSKDEEPINKFKGLFNMDQTPLLTEGAMDPKMLNHYVLLHDNQDGSAENASSILAEMKGTFGQYDCKMLCINSLREGDDNNSDVLWLPYRNYGILDNDKKCCLNTDDLNQIREFMQDLASNHIIPYMEQKIRVLNQQVSATRKGFRNQIKNLWWRKGKDDVPEATDGPMYTFSSIESQIRLLGDYAFMLRDYELALSNYRLLSTDYKLDKAWKRYAGVQEMCALSYFMLDQSRKDAEYCMENAFSTYLKVGSAQRNATRCGLWWAEMLKARSQFKDASSVYTRISNEEPTLHAAIMLEQASCCYLLSRPPMLRKYGFHLILAGNRYYMSDQKQHAIRAYRNALFVYRDYSWSYINDHVHFNIGRWYGSLGALDVAIKHVLEILACSHQSQSTQNLFLNEFFHFVQSAGKRFDVHKLRLPAINMSSYRVIHEDHRTYASAADFDMQESLWRDLEEDMIPTVSATRTNWLDSQPKSSLKKYDYCVCVAGEAVRVEIELKNPLQIPIPISGLSLMCEFSENSDASTLENGTASFSLDQSTGHTESPVNRLMDGDDSSFALAKFDLVLGAGETKRVKLKVTPKVEGILKIVGVRWTLSDSVVGYRYFEVDMKKKTKAKKAVKNSSGKNLILIVIKGVAKLEGRIDGLPEKASMGTLQLLNLKLRNTSESAIKNIKMKINHPRYLIPGSSQEIGLSFPHCLGKKDAHEEERSSLTDNKDTFKNLLFSFPESNVVHGGETFSWPIWFHCGTPGRVSLLISIYYEMENSSSGMTYRTLRMQHILEVLPSLDVSFVVSPCSSKLTEYLVRMDIINRSLLESFSFHQLSCVGNRWAISTLPSCTDITSVQTIVAGQALSCFFKIQDLNGGTEGECTGHGSDMLMGTEARRDALFDISKSPLINFHHQERHHQGKLDKRSESLMDFILISKAIGSNFELEAGSNHQLLSHHICHCSVTRKRSISWHMSGPPTIYHDFSSSFCEVDLHVDILNCSSNSLNVQLLTCDYTPDTTENPSSDLHGASDFSTKQSGWSDISLESDIKVMSSPKKVQKYHKPSSGSAPPFIWCGSCAIQLTLQPACTARVPLKVCVFAPGTYNLSNYELHWKDEAEGHSDTGTGQGHPFYLTVLEEPPSKVTTV